VRKVLTAACVAGLIASCSGTSSVVPTRSGHHHRASSAASGSMTPTGVATPAGPIPGFLLIADAGNNRMLLVDPQTKQIIWRYPKAGQSPSEPFNYDDDTFFSPDHLSIMTNQENQHTIQRISFPQGNVIWDYGHANQPGSAYGYLHTPDDAYVLPNGNVSVADIVNCRILVLSPGKKIVQQFGTPGNCRHDPPKAFGAPNGDTPLPGGGWLITEIYGSWVDRLSASGKLIWAVQAPVSYPSDAQLLPDGNILIASYTSPGSVMEMTPKGHVVWRYAPTSGPGALDHPSLAIMLPNGMVALNDDHNDRVIVIDPNTNKIVWQYGHLNHPGRAPGYLNDPDGIDFLPASVAAQMPGFAQLLNGKG
jgi:DNA-binding beta-propeller fold protein YncE